MYTTLGALAARTRRVKLGTLVTGVTYRNPAMLVKQVTTLDTISSGRAILGIGAAWNEDEHRGYGFEFPPVRERMDRLNEALQIARLMFSEDRPAFEGRFYRIEGALNVPRPIQRGGPPILIGGTGEKRTLRMVAKYADMSHWFGGSLDELKRKTDILEGYCSEIGRDASRIFKLIGAPVQIGDNERDIEQAAEKLRPYIDAGFRGFTFGNPTLNTPEKLEMAGALKRLLT